MRAQVGIPLIGCVAAFVLAFIALMAGRSPNSMENLHIIMFNTSEFGKDLVPTTTTSQSTPSSTSDCGGFLPSAVASLCASATEAVGSAVSSAEAAVESTLASIEDDMADELAEKIGIKQFYSLHVMNICEGDFTPNATSPDSTTNVTNCTTPLKSGQYNISARLDHELSVGPFNLNLADLGVTEDIQKQFDKIAHLLLAMAIFYILSVAFTGLAMLLAFAALVLLEPACPGGPPSSLHRPRNLLGAGPLDGRGSRMLVLFNLVVAALACVVLLVANVLTTAGARTAADEIGDMGEHIGISASVGSAFEGISWASFALMALVLVYWVYLFVAHRRMRRGLGRAVVEKEGNRPSYDSRGPMMTQSRWR